MTHKEIANKLRETRSDLLDISDTPCPPWPPRGVPIQVRNNKHWLACVSAGDGCYFSSNCGRPSIRHLRQWRYMPANWDIAPEWAKAWYVTELGESGFTELDVRVGGLPPCTGDKIVHVEHRPEIVE